LSLVTQRPGKSAHADACRLWMKSLLRTGIHVYVPEIADYEVRRELVRSGSTTGAARLNRLRQSARFLPITSDAMLLAADLCARARNGGWATADPHALDGDVILAAQTLLLGLPVGEIIVATVNVRHLSRYLAADLW